MKRSRSNTCTFHTVRAALPEMVVINRHPILEYFIHCYLKIDDRHLPYSYRSYVYNMIVNSRNCIVLQGNLCNVKDRNATFRTFFFKKKAFSL